MCTVQDKSAQSQMRLCKHLPRNVRPPFTYSSDISNRNPEIRTNLSPHNIKPTVFPPFRGVLMLFTSLPPLLLSSARALRLDTTNPFGAFAKRRLIPCVLSATSSPLRSCFCSVLSSTRNALSRRRTSRLQSWRLPLRSSVSLAPLCSPLYSFDQGSGDEV